MSCVRDFVTYVAAPRSTVTDPEYVDTSTRQEASTAALGKTETGEDIWPRELLAIWDQVRPDDTVAASPLALGEVDESTVAPA